MKGEENPINSKDFWRHGRTVSWQKFNISSQEALKDRNKMQINSHTPQNVSLVLNYKEEARSQRRLNVRIWNLYSNVAVKYRRKCPSLPTETLFDEFKWLVKLEILLRTLNLHKSFYMALKLTTIFVKRVAWQASFYRLLSARWFWKGYLIGNVSVSVIVPLGIIWRLSCQTRKIIA